MKLWLISQDVNTGWDTYDSAVVAEETEEEARRVDPSGYREWHDEDDISGWWMFLLDNGTKEPETSHDSWVDHIKDVKVEELGVALDTVKKGVICASFHAG